MKPAQAARGRVLALGAIALLAGLVASSDALHAWSDDLLRAAEELVAGYPLLGPVIFVGLAMASAMLFFFSSAILFPVGVEAWGAGISVVLLWLGWLLGGALAFFVGRALGRPVAARMAGEAALASLEDKVSGHLSFVNVLLIQLTMPSEIPGYVLGALGCGFWRYLSALAIAEIPYALGTAYLGVSFLERQATMLIIVGLAAVAVGGFLLYRRSRAHRRLPPV